jgi:hypothetical protein
MLHSDSEDLPPPLEDMSALLSNPSRVIPSAPVSSVSTRPVVQATSDFGFKKGFLSSKPKSSSVMAKPSQPKSSSNVAKPSQPKDIDMPFIQRKDAPNSLQFSEVRDQLARQMEQSKPQWMTDSLFAKIESNPALAKAFSDPAFLQAANDMATNPEAAFAKYSHSRPDLMDALRAFVGVLGEQMMPPQEPLPDHEQKLVDRVLNDPELQTILKDATIQRLLARIQSNPPDANRIMQESGPIVRAQLMKLVEVGLLSIQT